MKQYILTFLALLSFPCLQAQSLEAGTFSALGEETVTGNNDIQLTAICGQPFMASDKGDQLAYGFSEIVATTNEATVITGISLDKSTATMEAGESLQLTATVLPADADNRAVNWKSSNTTIATVSDNGLIKAIARGSATITATTASGMFAAECAITVTRTEVPEPEPQPVPVTSVSLDQTVVALNVKEAITLTATVLPANADNTSIRWASSNEEIARVERGVVTAVAPGTAVISVVTEDGNLKAECTVTVKDIHTAIETIDNANKVYPQWIENVLYVELLKAETIHVIHFSGRIQETIRGQAGTNIIAAGSYPSGIYLIRLENQTVKVIKK